MLMKFERCISYLNNKIILVKAKYLKYFFPGCVEKFQVTIEC